MSERDIKRAKYRRRHRTGRETEISRRKQNCQRDNDKGKARRKNEENAKKSEMKREKNRRSEVEKRQK